MGDGLVAFAFPPGASKAFPRATADMKRALRSSHAVLGRNVRGWERAAMAGGSRQQARMAGGIGSAASSSAVTLTIRNTRGAPGAVGSVMGSKRYRQFPAPVRPGWRVGVRGEGPLRVNDDLARRDPQIEKQFLQDQVDAAARGLHF